MIYEYVEPVLFPTDVRQRRWSVPEWLGWQEYRRAEHEKRGEDRISTSVPNWVMSGLVLLASALALNPWWTPFNDVLMLDRISFVVWAALNLLLFVYVIIEAYRPPGPWLASVHELLRGRRDAPA